MSMQPQMKIRFLDPSLHEWIKKQAEINKRTLNGEVNYQLEQAMLTQQKESQNGKKV
ncbi:hypothetical protein [Psychrobacter urativorans]|uniref:hypothetical protein n=1 Tax=Psychrobacter urativorans TaxID=45610 RepID=UPI000B041288|nr:hypothetical protein [Psychrobacter urativorans]